MHKIVENPKIPQKCIGQGVPKILEELSDKGVPRIFGEPKEATRMD